MNTSGVTRSHQPFEWAATAVRWVGATLRRVIGLPRDATAELRTGQLVVVVAGGLLIGWRPVAVGLVGTATIVYARRRAAIKAERREFSQTLPDAVDLLRLGAEADLTVSQAVAALADHGLGPVAGQAQMVINRTNRGMRLADALEGLRSEPVLMSVADALIDAERYGTPLARSLDLVAIEARQQRHNIAEQRARQLPVRLLAPLVLCALPATVVLAVIPVVAVSIDGISL